MKKKPTIDLYDLIDAFELQSNSFCSYVNKNTGQIIHLLKDEEFTDIQEDIDDKSDPEDFIPIPDTWEVKEQGLREEFCEEVADKKLKKALQEVIEEKGAFGLFETTLELNQMSDAWFEFLDIRLEEMAIDFCKEHHFAYVMDEERDRRRE